MCLRLIKTAAVVAGGLALVAGLVFGTEAGSYVYSSARSVQTAVREAVPVEFELQRARDMLDEIIPEMQANVRLIAQEEVEIAGLKADIQRCAAGLTDEQARINKLRTALETRQTRFAFAGCEYTREQVKEDLARRFDRFKEASLVHEGKKRLLAARERSLQAAVQMLEKTRAEKTRLEGQIQGLESQYRLVQAASRGSTIQVDRSKLARTEKLIGDIRKRLDVAERVLTHESRFIQPIAVDVIDETDLLQQVDEFFTGRDRETAVEAPQGGPEQAVSLAPSNVQ